jgi:hypothetical protein
VQLEDLFRAAQILQPVAAQIGQLRARRQPVAHQRSRRLRHQHLAPIGDRCHPGGPVHLQAHQATGRLLRLTAMHTHPHPNLLPAGPGMDPDRLLHLQHRRHTRPRRGEHGKERIPLRIDFRAAVRGQRRPDQRVMPSQHLRVDAPTQPPQQRRRALNIGKQKRESLHGQSVEGAGQEAAAASRHTIRQDPTRIASAADRLAGHPHGGHRSLTPRDARIGTSGRACRQVPEVRSQSQNRRSARGWAKNRVTLCS